MSWKKFSPTCKPRKEHERVLLRRNGRVSHSMRWCNRPKGDISEYEWLDHLEGGWIPVSERLPIKEEGHKSGTQYPCVLVQTRGDEIVTARWDHVSFRSGYFIAWQPLPPPYTPPSTPLWESEELKNLAVDAIIDAHLRYRHPGPVDCTLSHADVDNLQRELLERGLQIRKMSEA